MKIGLTLRLRGRLTRSRGPFPSMICGEGCKSNSSRSGSGSVHGSGRGGSGSGGSGSGGGGDGEGGCMWWW